MSSDKEFLKFVKREKSKPRFKCKQCKKEAKVTFVNEEKIKISCCGKTDYRYKDQSAFVRRDQFGRKHGPQPRIGTGEEVYLHGSLSFLDDGNGNVYDSDEIYNWDEDWGPQG